MVVGARGWEEQLERNKRAFALAWVGRPEFTNANAFPVGMAPAAFVDKLFANASIVPSESERSALIAELTADNTPRGRATVLLKVAAHASLIERERNRAFVLMQYFGYLRRNPDEGADANMDGFNFWLDKLNQFGGDYRRAEMVKAFISAIEYRQRFGQ